MSDKLRNFATQLSFVPRTLRLVWNAAPSWTVVWIVFLVIQGLLPAITVYLTRLLVDSLVLAIQEGGSWESIKPALSVAILIAGIMLLTQILQSIMEWVRTAQAELIFDYLTALVHEKSITVDLAFYELSEYHDRLYQARNELSSRPLALLESGGSLLQSAITLLAMVALLIPYGFWLPLVLVVSTLPAFYVMLRYNQRYHQWWKQTTPDRRMAQYYDMVLTDDWIAAEVRLFNLGPYFQSAFQQLRHGLRTGILRLIRNQGLARLGAGITATVVSGLTMVWFVWLALQGLVTLGDLTLFYQTFNRGQGVLRNLLGNLSQIYNNILFLENLFEFLELEPQINDPIEPVPLPAVLTEGIRFKQVTFRYPGSKRTVFQDFNFTIPAGKVVAIVGANGAGKTTMIKLLCRFYDPEDGSIELDGHDIRTLLIDEFRRMITVMFQFPMLYTATVAENVAMGDLKVKSGMTDIETAARRAGAHEFITCLPQGYDTLMGKMFADGTELSGGERQRLALARAFLRRAQIMILDEPTSFMDSWAEIDWFDRFRELANGRTVIIITHRLTIAKDADIIYVMDQGRIVESGSHQELLIQGGRYAQSWMAQIQDTPNPPNLNTVQSELVPEIVSDSPISTRVSQDNRANGPSRS